MLLPKLLLLLLELGLLLNELAHAVLQPLQRGLGEDQRLGEIQRQLGLHQVLDLVHLEGHDQDDLVQLGLFLLLEADDLCVDGLDSLVDQVLLLLQRLFLLVEGFELLLELNVDLFLVQALLTQVTDLLVQRLVAPGWADLLSLILVPVIIIVVLLLRVRLLLAVKVLCPLGILLVPLDLAQEDLLQLLPERGSILHQRVKLGENLAFLLMNLVDLGDLLLDLLGAGLNLGDNLPVLPDLGVHLVDQQVVPLLALLEDGELLDQDDAPDLRHLQVPLEHKLLLPQGIQVLVKVLHRPLDLALNVLHLVLQLPLVQQHLLDLHVRCPELSDCAEAPLPGETTPSNLFCETEDLGGTSDARGLLLLALALGRTPASESPEASTTETAGPALGLGGGVLDEGLDLLRGDFIPGLRGLCHEHLRLEELLRLLELLPQLGQLRVAGLNLLDQVLLQFAQSQELVVEPHLDPVDLCIQQDELPALFVHICPLLLGCNVVRVALQLEVSHGVDGRLDGGHVLRVLELLIRLGGVEGLPLLVPLPALLPPHLLLVQLFLDLPGVSVLLLCDLVLDVALVSLGGPSSSRCLWGLHLGRLLLLRGFLLLLPGELGLSLRLDVVKLLLHLLRQLRRTERRAAKFGLERMQLDPLDLNVLEEPLLQLLQPDPRLLRLVGLLQLNLVQDFGHLLVQHLLQVQVDQELLTRQLLDFGFALVSLQQVLEFGPDLCDLLP